MALVYSGVPLMLPTDEVAAWVRANFTLQDVVQFSHLEAPFKRRTQIAFTPQQLDRPVRPQTLWWPRGASRCAVGNFIISQDNLDAIRKTLTTYAAKTLEMSWYDENAKLVDQIRPSLYMLAATPVDQIVGANGLYLLTLVDDRYLWNYNSSGSWTVTENTTTWANVFTSLGSQISASISTDTINSAYLKPAAAFQHAASVQQPLPQALDAAAYNVGQRVIRTLGGAVKTQNATTATAAAESNLTTATARSPRAGGKFAYVASTKPNDLNAMVPAEVKVFAQKASSDVPQKDWHTETVTLASLALPDFKGVTGHQKYKAFHDTIVLDGNASEVTSLAQQIATDYYRWTTLLADTKFSGIVAMAPDGQSDALEWTYGVNEVSTRIIPGTFNDETWQLQHASASKGSIDRTWLLIEDHEAKKKPQRSFLQFRNYLRTSDGESDDKTIVDVWPYFNYLSANYVQVNGYLRLPTQPPPGGNRQGQIWLPGGGCSIYYYCDGVTKKLSGSSGANSSGVGPHNLLSVTHSDTEAFTPPSKGDMIAGNASAKWQALAAAAEDGMVLTSDAAETRGVKWDLPGWQWVDSQTASAAAVIDFTDLSADYAAYKVFFSGVLPATDNVTLYLRTSTDNGATFAAGASDYAWSRIQNSDSGTAPAGAGDTADSEIEVYNAAGNGANEKAAGEITIYNPSAVAYCRIGIDRYQWTVETGAQAQGSGGGVRLAAADVDAIRFLFSSGNIATGTFTVYGLKA